MSAQGQTRRFRDARRMSGLPPTADIFGAGRHFAFGPIRDIVAPFRPDVRVAATSGHPWAGWAMSGNPVATTGAPSYYFREVVQGRGNWRAISEDWRPFSLRTRSDRPG